MMKEGRDCAEMMKKDEMMKKGRRDDEEGRADEEVAASRVASYHSRPDRA
jgi:hypothetical protein